MNILENSKVGFADYGQWIPEGTVKGVQGLKRHRRWPYGGCRIELEGHLGVWGSLW